MIYDPATQTFNGPPEPPKSFLEQQYQGCATAIGIMILAPIMLVCRACEKIEAWQAQRFCALQDEVLKERPIAVLIRQLDTAGHDQVKEIVRHHAYRSLLTQPGQNWRGDDCEMEIVEPTKPVKEGIQPRWIILYNKDVTALNYDAVYGFFQGPDAWEKTRQLVSQNWEGREFEDNSSRLLATKGHPAMYADGVDFDFSITCFYDLNGTIYVYERQATSNWDVGFWKAKWGDKALLSAMRKVAR